MSDFQDKQGQKWPFKRDYSMQWCYMTIFAFVFTMLCCGLLCIPLKIALNEINARVEAVEEFLARNYLK